MDEKKKVLKSRGISKKGQGHKAGKTWKGEDFQRKNPTMQEVGPGSSFAMSKAREEAQRVRAEKRIPGNLGFQKNLGKREDVAGSVKSKGGKRMLYPGKKK